MSVRPKLALKVVDDARSGIDVDELRRLAPGAPPAAQAATPAARLENARPLAIISTAAKEAINQARQRLQAWIDQARSKSEALTRLANFETVRAAAVRDVEALQDALQNYMVEWAASGVTDAPPLWLRSGELEAARKHLQECEMAASGAEGARQTLQKAFEQAQQALPYHQNQLQIAALTGLAEHSGPLLDEL